MASHLRLVTEDEPVNLPIREPSTFDQGWVARQGAMKTRGLGKEPTRKLWEREAKRVGSAALLEALKRFLREKPEKDGYTHCGLSVWLNQQRADHWLVEPEKASCTRQYPLRKALSEALGESFVRSYLDPCQFTEDNHIIPATEFAKKKLIEKASVLKSCGLVGIRSKEVAMTGGD